MSQTEPQSPAERDKETLDALAALVAAQEQDVIDRALLAARMRLDMDAAYLSQITPEAQLVGELMGDSSALGFSSGSTIPIQDTFCSRMLRGEIPNVIPDTSAEPALRELSATKRIGAYVGIPIALGDGRVHGTLCCASSEPRMELGDKELEFMRVLAGIIAKRIDQSYDDFDLARRRLANRPMDN